LLRTLLVFHYLGSQTMPLFRTLSIAGVASALALAATLAPVSQAVGADDPGMRAERAAGEVKTTTRCRPGRYTPRYKIRTARQAPRVTHVSAYTLPPSGSHSETKRSRFNQRLSATANFNGSFSIGASGVAKVLVKAEHKLNVSLKAAGSRTTTKDVTITRTISNPTGSNKTFVFFRGWTKAYGGFRYYFCKIYYLPGQNYGPAFVTYRPGKWRSYRVLGEGAPRCGAGSGGNALVAAALRIGCP
jgi:hypothetical protein